MIRLDESGLQRDGTRWRARVRPGAKSGLREGAVYEGLGLDMVPGWRWIEDGKWARCVSERELERIQEAAMASQTFPDINVHVGAILYVAKASRQQTGGFRDADEAAPMAELFWVIWQGENQLGSIPMRRGEGAAETEQRVRSWIASKATTGTP